MMTNKYPVEVFWDKQEPSRNYEIIGNVNLQNERYYTTKDKKMRKELLTHYGDLPRGYRYDEKEILIFQLTRKAKEMGADAIMHINYSLTISQTKYGYDLSAVALKYR
ncbi:MAG: hypothetical protein OHK0045_24430 [Raineya sp.]